MVDPLVSACVVECDGGERSNTYVGEFSGEHIFACGRIVSDVHLRRQDHSRRSDGEDTTGSQYGITEAFSERPGGRYNEHVSYITHFMELPT